MVIVAVSLCCLQHGGVVSALSHPLHAFDTSPNAKPGRSSEGVIVLAGIVAGGVVGFVLVAGIAFAVWRSRQQRRRSHLTKMFQQVCGCSSR